MFRMQQGSGFKIGMAGIALLTGAGCIASEAPESVASAELSDIASIHQRSDGQFEVMCGDGTKLVVTTKQLMAKEICPATVADVILYANSNACDESSAVARLNSVTNCLGLSATAVVGSMRVAGGRCVDINDTNVRTACILRKPGANRTLIFGRSEACDESAAMASVSESTDCMEFSATLPAWSIKTSSGCKDVPDTTVRAACIDAQSNAGRVLIYGNTDACNENFRIGSATSTTDCQSFSSTASAGSIRVAGRCVDISDTSQRQACLNRP